MSIKKEQPRERILNANSLVNFRGGFDSVDLGRPFVAASGQLINKTESERDRKQAYADTKRGAADAGRLRTIDENGNMIWHQTPDESVEYQRGFDQSLIRSYEAQWERTNFEKLGQIQMQEDLEPGKRLDIMRAQLEGAVETVPDEYKGSFQQWATSQLSQRGQHMLLQRQRENEKLAVDEAKGAISFSTDQAIAHLRTGDMEAAQENLSRIEDIYEGQVTARNMTREFADMQLTAIRSEVASAGVAAITMDSLFRQEVLPSEINDFADVLEHGSPEGVMKALDGTDIFTAEGVRKRVETDEGRKKLAVELRRMAAGYSQWEAAHKKKSDFLEVLQNPKRYQGQFPSELNSVKDDFLEQIMQDRDGTAAWMTDDARVGQLMRVAVATKTEIKPVMDSLHNVLRTSSNSDDYVRALDLYARFKNLEDSYGDRIGDSIIGSMDEDKREFMDATLAAYEAGMPADRIRDAVGQMREVSIKDAMEAWKKFSGEDDVDSSIPYKMTKAIAQMWDESVGGMPPPEASNKVKSAFYYNWILTRDPEKAMKQSLEQVKKQFSTSEVLAYGATLAPVSDFENPYGWQAPAPVGVQDETMVPAAQPKYPWLEDYVKSELLQLQDQDADTLQLIGDLYADGEYQLGKKVFLNPVPNRPGEYHIMYEADRGALGDTADYFEDKDGKRITIRPGDKRAEISLRNQQAEEMEAMKLSIERRQAMDKSEREAELMVRARQPRLWENTDMPAALEWMDDLPDGMKRASSIEKDKLYARIDELRLKQSYDRGEMFKFTSKDQAKAFITPRNNGKPVVEDVVSAIDGVFPDGTGGRFLRNIAAVESNFGQADGTFRTMGDKGIWQINTGKSAAFAELKRVMAIPGHKIAKMADKAQQTFNLPLREMEIEDLDKPLVNGLLARLYMEHKFGSRLRPGLTVEDEARLWKTHYNTYLGAGSVEGYLRKVGRG